jgi:hypothetical protein
MLLLGRLLTCQTTNLRKKRVVFQGSRRSAEYQACRSGAGLDALVVNLEARGLKIPAITLISETKRIVLFAFTQAGHLSIRCDYGQRDNQRD